jgi:hypothetical protein
MRELRVETAQKVKGRTRFNFQRINLFRATEFVETESDTSSNTGKARLLLFVSEGEQLLINAHKTPRVKKIHLFPQKSGNKKGSIRRLLVINSARRTFVT